MKSRFWLAWLAAMLFALPAFSANAGGVRFAMKDVNGQPHSIAEERGHWLVVNVWATWCPPCRHELPELAAFARAERGKGIRVWGLSVDQNRSPAELSMFASEHHLGYPIFKVRPDQIDVFGSVPGIPTTFIVDPQGRVVVRHVGGVNQAMLQSMIAREQQLESR